MTYLQFHFVFTIPLFLLVLFLVRNNPITFSKKGVYGTLTLLFLALTYTTPWDSYLIHQEIWTYSPDNVIGTFLKIPFEEFFFFIIQTLTGCFFTSIVLKAAKAPMSSQMNITGKHLSLLAGSLSILFFAFMLVTPHQSYRYLALVSFWATPVLLMQWILGFNILKKNMTSWISSVLVLTIYFCIADSIAIHLQIWTFPSNTISGIQIFGLLPIEEALFFLATNLMVVQGYILFTTVDFSRASFKMKFGDRI